MICLSVLTKLKTGVGQTDTQGHAYTALARRRAAKTLAPPYTIMHLNNMDETNIVK